jgi:two-component system, chemotaxis family, chemotaxis protein CheY
VTEPVKKVLVVDDSAGVRQMVRHTFEGDGFEVLEAPNGPAALVEARNHPDIKAVYTDVNMPGMSGLELLGAIKSDPALKHLPVVIISAIVDPSAIGSAKSLGAVGWITKPISADALLATIRKITKALVKP